jgi:hypothetical protein
VKPILNFGAFSGTIFADIVKRSMRCICCYQRFFVAETRYAAPPIAPTSAIVV